MSILIKGMEMPTRCGECLLAKLSPTGESLICDYMLSRVSWDERPFDCPLVSVPPHGDLIDLKAPFKAQYYDEMTEQTNADRIRSMTDEELADFLWSIGQNPGGWNYIDGKPIFHTGKGNGWLDWLKQEAQCTSG